MSERSELDALREALAQAVQQASQSAELASLLTDYHRRLDDAARVEAVAVTRMRQAEGRLKAEERQHATLAKNLAEQRYENAVANWKLASLRERRWSKLCDALHSKNPGKV